MQVIIGRRRSERDRIQRRAQRTNKSSRRRLLLETLENRWLLAGFTVNDLGDTVDIIPGDGLAQDAAGRTTLRAAIMESNALPGSDTITLGAGTYTRSLAGSGEDGAATGDLDITDDVTIVGAGRDVTVIDAAGLDRVFHVFAGTSVNFSGVTLTGGDATSGAGGGGIFNEGGTIDFDAGAITGSQSSGGGGIFNVQAGVVTITDSTISGNTALGANSAAGGLFNSGFSWGHSTMTVVNSTIAGNTAGLQGGGLLNSGTLSITNSTLSANVSGGGGGAIYNNFGPSVEITNSTITDNVANGLSGYFQRGGGITNFDGNVTLKNTLVANNNAATGSPDVYSTGNSSPRPFTSLGNNLIGDNGLAVGFGAAGDQIGTSGAPINPLLGPLQDNGGPTFTHALLPGSPAIDAGNNALAPATDQRGVARPQDGNNDSTAVVDIGAFEFLNSPPIADDDAVSVNENDAATNVTATLLNGDSDPDASDVLSVSAIDTTGTIGTVSLNAGVVHYDPDGQFESLSAGATATDTFSYTLSDGNGGTDSAVVTVTINGQNDQPQISDGSVDFEIIETLSLPAGGVLLDVRDMDGDGQLDVVVRSSGTVYVYEQSGASMVQRFSAPASRGAVVGDVDRDGIPEIAAANSVFGSILTVYEATGDNSYGTILVTEEFQRAIEGDPVTGDSDNDGNLEYLVAVEGRQSLVRIVESTANNTFAELTPLIGNREDAGITGVLDLDGDGLNEVVFADDGGSPTYTTRVFENGTQIYSDPRGGSPALGDTDGNGVPEIVISKSGGGLAFLETDGANGFNTVADTSGLAPNFYVDLLEDDVLEMLTVAGNTLTAWSRSGTSFSQFWDSGSLFQGSTQSISSVIGIDETNGDGIPEFAVLQGNQLHLVQEQAPDSVFATLTESDSTLSTSGTLTVQDLDLGDALTLEVTSVVESGPSSGIDSGTLLNMLSAEFAHHVDSSGTVGTMTLFGGPGDQAAYGVAQADGELYVAGSGGLLANYSIPLSTADWTTSLAGNGHFGGVTLAAGHIFPVGSAVPPTCGAFDSRGGTEGKVSLAQFELDGTFTNCQSANFFSYRGGEGNNAAITVQEGSSEVVYVGGRGELFGFGGLRTLLSKYDGNGNLLWKRNYGSGSSGGSGASGLAWLNGQLYVAGTDNNNRGMLLKYDAAAQPNDPSPGSIGSTTLVADWSRLTTFTGHFQDVAAIGDALYAVGGDTSGVGGDYLVQKYDQAGNLLWSTQSGGSGTDTLHAIVGVGSRIFAVGYTTSEGAGGRDAVLVEIDSTTGEFLSTTLFGGAQDDLARDIATDGSSLFIIGESRSYSQGGNSVGQNDAMIISLPIPSNQRAIDWSFNSGGEAFDHLAVGESQVVTYTVRATDDSGVGTPAIAPHEDDIDVVTVVITINGTNDPPTANDDSGAAFTTDEDSAFATGNVVANDTDLDLSDVLSVQSIDTTGTLGSVTDNGDGTFDYDPNGQFDHLASGQSATDTFSYTVSDGNGGTDVAVVTVTINGVNDPPVANDDSGAEFTTDEDSAFTTGNVLTNDTDPDLSDVLAVQSIDTTGTLGLVTDNGDGTFDYDPNGQFESLPLGATASDTFTYTVSDVSGETDEATVTISIAGVNDPPVANDDGTNAAFSDDFEAATLDPFWNYLFESSGSVVFPSTEQVYGGNQSLGLASVSTGTAKQVLLGHDFSEPTYGTFSTWVYDSGADITSSNYLGIYLYNNAIGDWRALRGVDYDFGGNYQVHLNQAGVVDTGVDRTIGWHQFVVESTPSDLRFSVDGALVHTAPPLAFDRVQLTLHAPSWRPAWQTYFDNFEFTPHRVFETDENTVFTTSNVLENDTDPDSGDVLAVQSIDTTGTLGSVTDNADGTFQYDPAGQFDYLASGETATDTFSYTVSDGNGGTDTAVVTVTINGVNDPPVANDDSGGAFTTDEDSPFTSGNVLDNDTDPDASDVLTVQSVDTTGTLGLVTDNGDGTFDYDANDQFESLAIGESATDTFSYTVSDGNGGTDVAVVTVTINGVNDPPVANDDSGAAFTTDEDSAFATGNVLTNDTDPDASDVLTVQSIDTTGTLGSVTDNNNGTFGYDPNGQFEYLAVGETATDTFSYTVSDGNGGTDVAVVTVTISGVNDPPVANDDSGADFTTDEDSAFTTGSVLTNDTDLDQSDVLVVLSIDTTGTLGSVTDNGDGTFDYDPNGQFESLAVGETATDTFGYTVSDPNGGTDVAVVTVTINGVNDLPVANDDSGAEFTTDEDSAFTTGSVLTNDTDPDASDVLTVLSIDTTGTLGLVTDNTDGTFGYDPNGQFDHLASGESATDTFSYTVSDPNGGTDVALVTVTINGVNDPPVANDDSGAGFTTDEDSAFTTGNVLTNDTDPDASDVLTVLTVDTTVTFGLVTDNGDGTFDYDPNGQFESLAVGESATDTFSYIVSDGNGGTDSALVTVTINGINDQPGITVEPGDSAAETITETDSTLSTSGTLTVQDLDLGDALNIEVLSVVESGPSSGINNGTLLDMLSAELDSLGTATTVGTITLFGGAGDQAAYGVSQAGGELYVAGSGGLLANYSIPLSAADWTTSLTGNGHFGDLTIADGHIIPVGSAVPPTCGATDGVGDTEGKVLLAQYELDGTFTDCQSANFFPYTGGESNNAAITVQEGSSEVVYAGGRGELLGFGRHRTLLSKYDSSGNLLWKRNYGSGSSGGSGASGLAWLNGQLYVAGTDNNNRGMLLKYDAAAQPNDPSPSATGSTTLVPDWSRLTTFTGHFQDVAAIGNALYAVGGDTSGVGGDYLVQKYDQAGNLLWSTTSGGTGTDTLHAIVGVGSRIFAVGYTTSQGAGGRDAVLVEIDPASGDLLWTKLFGGAQDDLARDIATDGNSLFIIGESRSYSQGGNSVGENDAMIISFPIPTADGTINWSFNSGGEAFNHLAVGESQVLTYTIRATDDSGVGTPAAAPHEDDSDLQSVMITINGTNDSPTINVDSDAVVINEGQVAENSGTFDDVDMSDSVAISASIGTIVFQDSGNSGDWEWEYSGGDDVATTTVTITANDGHGGIETVTFDLTVNNVAPVANTSADQTVDEGDLVTLSGTFTDVGLDDGHKQEWSVAASTGQAITPLTIDNLTGDSDGAGGSNFSFTPIDDGTYTVTYTVTDDDGGVHSDTAVITVNNVAPAANAGADQTVNEGTLVTLNSSFTDVGLDDGHKQEWSVVASTGQVITPLTIDNLAGDSDGSGGSSFNFTPIDDGTYTVTYTVTDDDGGVHSDTAVITVNNVAPVANAGADQTVDEGTLVTLSGTFTDVGLDDGHKQEWSVLASNGEVVTPLTIDNLAGDSDGSGGSNFSFTPIDDGTYTVTYTVTDDDGGVHSDTAVITVNNVAPSVSVDNPNLSDSDAEQYSDSITTITFTATDIPNDPMSAVIAYSTDGGSTYSPGLPDDGTVTGGLVFGGANGQTSPAVWTISGVADLAPGNYRFKLTVSDDDGGTSALTTDLVVAEEDATPTYAGALFVSTDNDGEFAVEIRTVVQDGAFFNGPDSEGGDITRDDIPTATVTYIITPDGGGGSTTFTVDVEPIDSDPLTGVAVATFADDLANNVDSQVYTIEILVNGYYVGSDVTVLTVARPEGDFITGGGAIVEANSFGGEVPLPSGDVQLELEEGSNINFGYNAKWNKKRTNLQGQFNAILRGSEGERWQIKSTATDTLVVVTDPDSDPSTDDFAATMTTKAVLKNLTLGESVGGLQMIVTLHDNGEPGSGQVNPDTIGFTVWDGSTLLFSTNWTGSATDEQELDKGNNQIHTEGGNGKKSKNGAGFSAAYDALLTPITVDARISPTLLAEQLMTSEPQREHDDRDELFSQLGRLDDSPSTGVEVLGPDDQGGYRERSEIDLAAILVDESGLHSEEELEGIGEYD